MSYRNFWQRQSIMGGQEVQRRPWALDAQKKVLIANSFLQLFCGMKEREIGWNIY